MKKYLLFIVSILLLSGCNTGGSQVIPNKLSDNNTPANEESSVKDKDPVEDFNEKRELFYTKFDEAAMTLMARRIMIDNVSVSGFQLEKDPAFQKMLEEMNTIVDSINFEDITEESQLEVREMSDVTLAMLQHEVYIVSGQDMIEQEKTDIFLNKVKERELEERMKTFVDEYIQNYKNEFFPE